MQIEHRYLLFRPLVSGVLGAGALLGIFFGILTLSNSLEHAFSQFLFLWAWMVPLVIGFGIQAGFFFYMKGFAKLAEEGSSGSGAVIATGGVSTGSMVACCLHHVTDVLPLLGVSAVSLFLSRYQSLFLALGIVSNLLAIGLILYTVQRHRLYRANGLFDKILRFDMKGILWSVVGTGALVLTLMAYPQFTI